MKNLNHLLIIGTLLGSALLSNAAYADKMNNETQDLVIKKMERVLSAMDVSDTSYIPSQQRLADLLSERARTRFMAEVDANCDGCKGSKDDRQKAIEIYEKLLVEVKLNEHGPILFQLAHLYDMAGQPDKAITLYERIIKEAKQNKISEEIISKAHVGLGDLLFQKGKFTAAHEHYVIALKDKNLDNRALTVYNMAWCEFNTDQLNKAISTLENLLKKPEQITRDTEAGSKYDAAFHSDIMRDLATFYSRKSITAKQIDTYDQLLPKEKRKELLLNFSQEADRVGQKQAAHDILQKYLDDPSLTKEERLDAFVNMAQVNYDRGQTTQSTQDFAKAAASYQSTCGDAAKCEKLEKTMKRYVTELHRSKKVKPDQDLLNAYMIYNKTFPNDAEMANRGAQVALQMNKYPVAVQFYRSVSENRSVSDKDKHQANLNEISAAEKSNDPAQKKDAYAHFLKTSSDKTKSFEVRYQMAYLTYQQKQYKEAAKAFNELVGDSSGSMDLRKKSADLSLDCLAQLHNDDDLQEWALDYAKELPQARAEYQSIQMKALMNQVAQVANDSKASRADLERTLKKVLRTDITQIKPNEKILFYTNESVLAQKLNEDEVYLHAMQGLLAMPEVSAPKKQELSEQVAGYYERKLDFKDAYLAALKVRNPKVSEKERQFRLGTLADLAELNPSSHYRAALHAGLTGERALVIRSRLVLLSANPVAELKAQARELKQRPVLLNDALLLVYAKTGNRSGLKAIFQMKELRNQPAARFIQKQDFYDKEAQFKRQIAAHSLNLKNDRTLTRTITERMKLLKKADSLLNESLSIRDVTAQMVALEIVAHENERMVHDLASMPMPKKLTVAQQHQYVEILKSRSKPYLYKARVAQQKQNEIWNNSSSLAQSIRDYKTVRPELKKLLAKELEILNGISGTGKLKVAVGEALGQSSLTRKDLIYARKNVSENPDNIREIENLKYLETQIGHPLMPAYLEARLNHIQKGKSL